MTTLVRGFRRAGSAGDDRGGRIGAVKEGRDISPEAKDPPAGALSFGTVLGLPILLDGDPGTTA